MEKRRETERARTRGRGLGLREGPDGAGSAKHFGVESLRHSHIFVVASRL